MRRYLLVALLAAVLLGLLAAPAVAGAATFTVAPSGGDDTHNIQKALNQAIKAGPGSVVQLSAGHFYMNGMTVDGFDGYFQGAGKDKTVIDCLRGLDPSLPGVSPPPNMWSFFMRFRGGYPRVSDMTFDISAHDPCRLWSRSFTFIDELIWIRDGASSSFDNVRFKGRVFEDGWFNVMDVICYSDTGGEHTMTSCDLWGILDIRAMNLSGAKMTIGGGPGKGNTFDAAPVETIPGNALFSNNSDCDIEISYNQMRCPLACIAIGQSDGAAFVEQPTPDMLTPLPATRFLIRNNTMTCVTDGAYGWGGEAVFLTDQSAFVGGDTDRLQAVISDNTIIVDNGGVDAPIVGAYTNGIKVLNNRISGTAMAAVMVETLETIWGWPPGPPDGPAVGSSGWQIVGNDVSGLHAVPFGDRPAAQIWLGQGASDCLVIGGGKRTTVLDEGTDNTLIGVKELEWTPSAEASSLTVPATSAVGQSMLQTLMKRH